MHPQFEPRPPLTWLRKRLLAIPAAELALERRGFFDGEPRTRRRLEEIVDTFRRGHQAGLEFEGSAALARELERTPLELRGFAFEGAAMALALLDRMSPWRRRRWRAFLDGPGRPHVYMLHVGAGLAMARLHSRLGEPPQDADPIAWWLVADGYGFHEGFFHPSSCATGAPAPARVVGYARRAFDQGLGRSLWFSQCADGERIGSAIASFSATRRADLWSGVGLACAYAGGIDRDAIERLLTLAGMHAPELAQGAAFAAEARQRAGNPAPHTDEACTILCGSSAADAAALTTAALADIPDDREEPVYEVWRRRIQAGFRGCEVAG